MLDPIVVAAQVERLRTEMNARPSGGKRRCAVFETSGVWTPPEGVEVVDVLLVGGGGGGGGTGYHTGGSAAMYAGTPGQNGGNTIFLDVVAYGGKGGGVSGGPNYPSIGGQGGGVGGGLASGAMIPKPTSYTLVEGCPGISGLFSHGGGGGGGGIYTAYWVGGNGVRGLAGQYSDATRPAGGGSWGSAGKNPGPGAGGGGGKGTHSYTSSHNGGGGGGGEVVFIPVVLPGGLSPIPVLIGSGGKGGAGYGSSGSDPGIDGSAGLAIIYWWE